MEDEPRQSPAEWTHPAAGYHEYPPRKRRWPAPRRACTVCEAVSETPDEHCPVCGSAYPKPSLVARLLRRRR